MEKRKLVDLNNRLNAVRNLRGNIKFSYAVTRNLSFLKEEIAALEFASKEYTQRRAEIIKGFYKLDEKTKNPVVVGNQYQITDVEKLEKALIEFDEESKDFLDKYKELLKEEVDVKLYKIDLECFEGLFYTNEKGEEKKVQFSAEDLSGFDLIIKEE